MRDTTHIEPTTSEELLEEEIEELERPMLHSFLPWVLSIGALIVLSGVLAFFFFLAPRGGVYRGPTTASGLPVLALAEPQGHIKAPPPIFRWQPVRGAATYVITVSDADSSRVILLRPVDDVSMVPTDTESALFKPGLYSWTVEARGPDQEPLAAGETAFVISAS